MVADPGQYRWSSYRAYGIGQSDARLTPHPLYLAQGRRADERSQAYRTLFRPHLDAEAAADIRLALQLGMPVGQDRFAAVVCARAGIRFNSGKRGRQEGKPYHEAASIAGQGDFGFWMERKT
jgi:putative transposase